MSQYTCSQCGRTLRPQARFCSYCGLPVGAQKDHVTPEHQLSPVAPSREPLSASSEDASSTVGPMPPAVEAAFILRGKLEKLRTKKASLEEELETERVKQLVGEITEAEAKTKIDQIEGRLAPIAEEIEELEAKTRTPLEVLQQEQNTQNERLARLEKLRQSGEVEATIYQRLTDEYSGKLKEITQQLEAEHAKVQAWLHQLETRRHQLEFDKETLQVRAKINDISKRELTKQLASIEKELAKITRTIDGIRSLISESSSQSTSSTNNSQHTRMSHSTTEQHCPHCNGRISSDSKYCYLCGHLLTK